MVRERTTYGKRVTRFVHSPARGVEGPGYLSYTSRVFIDLAEMNARVRRGFQALPPRSRTFLIGELNVPGS